VTSQLITRGPLKGLPREVGVLAAVAFCVAAGFGIVAPAIPVFARTFGVSRTASGAVISAFALMRIVSVLGVGRLINSIGERKVLGIGIAVVAASSAVAGLSQSYGQLIALRGIGGVGSAMFSVSAVALLLRSAPGAQRGRAMGSFSGGFLLGGIAGPALGGVVTGISLRAPFFIYAATLAVAGAVGLSKLPRPEPAGSDAAAEQEPHLTFAAAVRLPAFRAAALANLADSWAALGVRSALVPLFVVESLHEKPLWTGLGFVVFTLANLLTLYLGGRWSDSRGRKPALVLGCFGSAAGVGLLVGPPSLPLLLVSLLVFGLGSGLLDVAPGAMVGDVVGGRGGTVIASYQMAGDLGNLAGPVVAGAVADTVSFQAAFGVTALVLAAAGLFATRAPETLAAAGPGPAAAPV
jgi:DHA1 family multidrug resistance protein-like MFS transporter